MRLAKPHDIPRLVALSQTVYQSTYAAAYGSLAQCERDARSLFTPGEVLCWMNEPSRQCCVHEEASQIVAMGLTQAPAASLPESDTLSLERLYVMPPWQGQGFGALMMQECLNRAVQLGYRSIALWSWKHNEKALRFYLRHGFLIIGEQSLRLGTQDFLDVRLRREF